MDHYWDAWTEVISLSSVEGRVLETSPESHALDSKLVSVWKQQPWWVVTGNEIKLKLWSGQVISVLYAFWKGMDKQDSQDSLLLYASRNDQELDSSSQTFSAISHRKSGFPFQQEHMLPTVVVQIQLLWTSGWWYSLSSGTLTLWGQPERLRWWGYSPVTCPVPSHPGMGHLVSLFSGLGESAKKVR